MPKAARAYENAFRQGKGDPNVENTYAGFLCRTGKSAAGEKLFTEVAASPLYQTPEVALLNAGVCVHEAGDVVDAERYFNKALDDSSEHGRGLAAARATSRSIAAMRRRRAIWSSAPSR